MAFFLWLASHFWQFSSFEVVLNLASTTCRPCWAVFQLHKRHFGGFQPRVPNFLEATSPEAETRALQESMDFVEKAWTLLVDQCRGCRFWLKGRWSMAFKDEKIHHSRIRICLFDSAHQPDGILILVGTKVSMEASRIRTAAHCKTRCRGSIGWDLFAENTLQKSAADRVDICVASCIVFLLVSALVSKCFKVCTCHAPSFHWTWFYPFWSCWWDLLARALTTSCEAETSTKVQEVRHDASRLASLIGYLLHVFFKNRFGSFMPADRKPCS